MIRYDLICDKGHEFDGWFSDSAAYEGQARGGLVSCSVCNSIKIEKQVMAPGIPMKANRKADAPQKMMAGPVDPRSRMLLDMMREVRKSVEANAEYVGGKFAEEARKIHYAETAKRGIYGEASTDDAKALIDEGIDVHPLPRLPEDGN
ncbi:MAG: DUF1178 family protein [Rhizobiales bacterium]|nr:DUF1178 family protein [Hyphomicrobiales bacterium]